VSLFDQEDKASSKLLEPTGHV
jgi:hypothetical protein